VLESAAQWNKRRDARQRVSQITFKGLEIDRSLLAERTTRNESDSRLVHSNIELPHENTERNTLIVKL
jgi:hypothetical protein